jgi:diguanylate cyclase (GGDEF)-like protein
MKQNIPDDELHKLIGEQQINLPSPPSVAVKILNAVQNKECSLEDLEKIITADPALTGKLLRIANSAFYSLPNEVSNISRALSILGTNVIKNIALSFVIAGNMRGEENDSFNFDYFWRRSVTAAVAAELVTGVLHEKDDDIFVTALLQDIGILTMYLLKGSGYAATLKHYIDGGGTDLIQAEQELYRFDHQQLGYILLESWGIPATITMPMLFHHEPEKAPERHRRTALILNMANLLSSSCNNTQIAALVRELQKKMHDYFGITPDRTRDLLDDVARKSIDILNIFEIDPGQMKPYSQILQEANEELGKLNLTYEQLVLELTEAKKKSEIFAKELGEANLRLEQLAFRDGLTSLYNHRYFQEVLKNEMARARRYQHSLCLIMFDIDFFKKVNDSFGHPAGDQVLINMANAVSASIRPSDILARYGGEEFVLILPETSQTGMKVFAERLRRCVAALTTVFQNQEIKVTISSGGVHFSPDDQISPQQLIDIADRGLYLSKENGRNRVTILPIETPGR